MMSVSSYGGDDPAGPMLVETLGENLWLTKQKAKKSALLFVPLGFFGWGRSGLLLVLFTACLDNGREIQIQ